MKVYEPKLLVLVDYLDTVFIFRGVRRIADGSEVGVAVHGEVVGVVGIGVISGRLVFVSFFFLRASELEYKKPEPKEAKSKEKRREGEEKRIKEGFLFFLFSLFE